MLQMGSGPEKVHPVYICKKGLFVMVQYKLSSAY